MTFHSKNSLGARHPPHNWEYADATARLAATGFTTADVGKEAWQQSDDTYYRLADDSPITWVQLGGGSGLTAAQHAALRQLTHFIDNGPAEEFASGAYREMTGTAFPTAIIWYNESGVGKLKIVEKLITWTDVNPTTIVWKVYDASEVLLATITDTVTYSGIFETSRVRTIA